jgi:THO complex subunit 2
LSFCVCRVKKADLQSQAAAAKEFVQHCILTRLFLSPKDAIYCVEFLRLVHKLSPPGLRLLSVVDRLFKELGFMVRTCTARESINLGIFFCDLMSLVSRWRSKKVYEDECSKSEVFKSYKSGNLEPVSHGEFIRLSANWHKRLTLDVFKSCIISNDYMQMKNVLLVLNRMVRIYPATKEDAEELLMTLKPISESDEREDLKTLARMYCTGLEMSIRDRQMVATRQEYAGLPPPPKKKADDGAPQTKQSSKSTKEEKDKKKFIKDSKRKKPESSHAEKGGHGDNHNENSKARSKHRDDRKGNGHTEKRESPNLTMDNVKSEKGGSTRSSRPTKSRRRDKNEESGGNPERAEQNRDFADKRARRKSGDGTNKTSRNPERTPGDSAARRHEPKNEGRSTKSRDVKKRSRSDEDIYSQNDQSKRSRRDEGTKKERKKSPSRGEETRSKRSFHTAASPSSSRHEASRRPDKEGTAQRDHRRDRRKR